MDQFLGALQAQKAGKLKKSRKALEAAMDLGKDDLQRCDAHRMLVSVYAETDQPERMYESMEFIVAHAPYPAFSSLALRSMLAIVRRKGWENETVRRYAEQLRSKPDDRVVLRINERIAYLLQSDHQKRGELLQRLIDLDRRQGKEPDPEQLANRAFAHRLSHEYVKAAELYESTSKLSKDLQSHCLMEAAGCWKKAEKDEKALEAAVKSHELGPDKKSRRSLYSYHRNLADLFLGFKKRDVAIHHFELALEESPIDAYRKQCEESLGVAKALASQ